MVANILTRLAHLSIFAHMLVILGVMCFVTLAVVAVAGDDWNKPADDFDNWENLP